MGQLHCICCGHSFFGDQGSHCPYCQGELFPVEEKASDIIETLQIAELLEMEGVVEFC